MEDAHTILLQMPDDQNAAFFAVFDGHGGAKVANYAAENLYKGICSNQLYVDGQIEEALKTVFVEFDEMMFNDEKMRDELAGSTAVSVLVKDSLIYCANIGDSRAVASFAGHVDALSLDHKPTCPDEMRRIVSAGGWVQFNRVNGNLALSRAFGDFVFKRNEKRSATEQIVIAYPDVQSRPLTDDLEFIVLACDGVWDVMTNEEVVEFVRRRLLYRLEPVLICEELITRCLAPDCQMGSGIGCDNMTVILICYLNGATFEEFCDRVEEANPKPVTKQSRKDVGNSPGTTTTKRYYNDDDQLATKETGATTVDDGCSPGRLGLTASNNNNNDDDGGEEEADHDSDGFSSDTSSACSFEDIATFQSQVPSGSATQVPSAAALKSSTLSTMATAAASAASTSKTAKCSTGESIVKDGATATATSATTSSSFTSSGKQAKTAVKVGVASASTTTDDLLADTGLYYLSQQGPHRSPSPSTSTLMQHGYGSSAAAIPSTSGLGASSSKSKNTSASPCIISQDQSSED